MLEEIKMLDENENSTDVIEKKSVTFGQPPIDGKNKIVETSDFFRIMQKGTEMIKLRGSSRQYNRLYYMNSKLNTILWYPTSKMKERAKINIEELKEVKLGCSDYATRALGRKINFSSDNTISSIQRYIVQSSEEVKDMPNITSLIQDPNNERPTNSKTKQIVVNMNMINTCAFTIVYGRNFDSLELLTKDPSEANIWVIGLNRLLSNFTKGVPQSLEAKDNERDLWLLDEYQGFIDKTNSSGNHSTPIESINENMLIQLITKLSRQTIPYRIKQYAKQYEQAKGSNNRGNFDQNDFINIFKETTSRPEVYFVFANYSTDNDYLSIDDLANFLEVEQHISTGVLKMAEAAIKKYEPNPRARDKLQFSIDGFTDYLLSSETSAFDPKHLTVCQDMSQPLPNYFISSSNKLYITGDMPSDVSIVDNYQRALMSGCRYLEIELYDGSDGVPTIGQNLNIPSLSESLPWKKKTTEKQSFLIEVLDLIDKLAFIRSEFPLIISIENHLSAEQQSVLAHILVSIFKDRLLTPQSTLTFRYEERDQGVDFDRSVIISQVRQVDVQKKQNLIDKATGQTNWPSPLDLVGKILLKGRRLPPTHTGSAGIVSEESTGCLESEKYSKPQKLIKELSDLFFLDSNPYDVQRSEESRKSSVCSLLNNFRSKGLRDCVNWRGNARQPTQDVIANDLVVVGGRSASVKKSNNNSLMNTNSLTEFSPLYPYRMETVTEDEFIKETYTKSASKIIQFSRQCLLRVSPSKMRSNSSNQMVFESWLRGSQIAPINYQVPGLIMDLVTGFFGRNGACGFVLKPLMYRDPLSYFDPFDNDIQGQENNVQYLQLRIISAQQLPKPSLSGNKGEIIEPYVVVECHGIPSDCNKQKTKTIHGSPVYGANVRFDEVFNFRVQLGSMALIRFLILDDDSIADDFIAQSCIPFDCLRPGYRHIRLRNYLGEPLPYSTLFVHIAITNSRNHDSVDSDNQPSKSFNTGGTLMNLMRGSTTKSKQKVQLRKIADNKLSEIFKKSVPYVNECEELEESVYYFFEKFRKYCGDLTSFSMHHLLRNLISQLTTTAGTNEPMGWPIRMIVRKEDNLPHMIWSLPNITAGEDNAGSTETRLDTVSLKSATSVSSSFQNMLKRRSILTTQKSMNNDNISIQSGSDTQSNFGIGGLTKVPSLLSLNSMISSSSLAIASTPTIRIERLKKIVENFEKFIEASKAFIKKSSFIQDKLQAIQKEASDYFYQTLDEVALNKELRHKANFKGNDKHFYQRFLQNNQNSHNKVANETPSLGEQISDNYIWNMRLIMGCIQQLQLCLKEVNTWLSQAKDAASTNGVMNVPQNRRQLYHQTASLLNHDTLSISSSDRINSFGRSFDESSSYTTSPAIGCKMQNARLLTNTSDIKPINELTNITNKSLASSQPPHGQSQTIISNTAQSSPLVYNSMKRDSNYYIPRRSSILSKANSLDTRSYRPLSQNSMNRYYK